jgi:hypothetical protein
MATPSTLYPLRSVSSLNSLVGGNALVTDEAPKPEASSVTPDTPKPAAAPAKEPIPEISAQDASE